jgi:methionyl-tRNA formyltransferase
MSDTDYRNKKIVFVGAERVGLAALKTLLKMQLNVIAVYTATKMIKDKIADYVEFDSTDIGIPINNLYKVHTTNDKTFISKMEELQPDLIIVTSWSYIIPNEIFKICPVIGFHYSLLPDRRGGAPINWAIIDGEKETGISMYRMNDIIDGGDIIDQCRIPINETDTPRNILDKIEVIIPYMIENWIICILNGVTRFVPQDIERIGVKKVYKQRKPEDSDLDKSHFENLKSVYDYIRALDDPYPNAFLDFANKFKIKFSKARMENNKIYVEGVIE